MIIILAYEKIYYACVVFFAREYKKIFATGRVFMKTWKALVSKLLILAMALSLPAAGIPAAAAGPEPVPGDIVILYTNDVHCGVDQKTDDAGAVVNIGYAGVAAYKKEMEAIAGTDHVTLIDAGDAVQGEAIGTLSKGEYLTDIMNQTGYDIFVPGNHEFDYGMARMQELMRFLDAQVISANFVDLKTQTLVYEPYAAVVYGEGEAAVKIAYIGVTTPESFTKSTPAYFQDDDGNYIYGFMEGGDGHDLYAAVQEAVDAARAGGADYVIVAGHLGVDAQSAPWRSVDVIANTDGIDAFIDGHSHSVVESDFIANKNGEDVLLTQTGTKLANIGRMVIKADGSLTAGLIAGYAQEDPETKAFIADINSSFAADLAEKIGETDVALTVSDPETGDRMVRRRETNLGDLCADAYRYVLGNGKSGAESGPADVAFVNGGGVRADIDAGDISFGEVIAVHPFNNVGCVVEATGQEILDALEMGARTTPDENGGFLQVSGLTYTIDVSIPSTVVRDDYGNFVEVSGARRVRNVRVGDAPLDPNKIYTLASHNYMLLDGGDGINMFRDNAVAVQPVLLDNQVLISYIQDYLNGTVGAAYANPYGQNRIQIKEAAVKIPASGFADSAASLGILQLARYSAGKHDPEGGVQEIVTYNPGNQFAYSVNGKDGVLTAISLSGLTGGAHVTDLAGNNMDVKTLVGLSGFTYGDMTSVAVSPDGTILAAAIQAEQYDRPGCVAVFACGKDGGLTFVRAYSTGVQPDMVVFADDRTILTADEGEPRAGYGTGATDPKGSVTIVDLNAGSAVVVDFTGFDAARADLAASGVVLKKGTAPSADFEPEYIAVADGKAYVSLQEANAAAVLDLTSKRFSGVYPLGVQDYSKIPIDLDNDPEAAGGAYTPRYYESVYGLRMPDGIAAYSSGGKTYVLTANEGDSREWGEEDSAGYHLNEREDRLTATDGTVTNKKVRMLSQDYEGQPGLADGAANYLFGGRSFSIFEADADGLTLVYDSGADFENKTAAYLPEYFNCSNDDVEKDSRSNKKGPEPETVTVGAAGGKTYAFIGLERIGGVMVYDISDPARVAFENYVNSRNFEDVDPDGIGDDDSPEGLKFIPAGESPAAGALLLTAFEVSGDVSAYALTPQTKAAAPVKLAIISDVHLYDGKTLGDQGAAFEAYLAGDRKMLRESEQILDEAIRRILASDAAYVLLAGDLTKDGEAVNHALLAEKLKVLKTYGKQVFVTNGNHDLSNAYALSYSGAGAAPADTVDSGDFKRIYAAYGYDQAVAQDARSLSYAADLDDGYRLIVMDSCIYNDDKGTGRAQETGGRFSPQTFEWILSQIKAAIKDGRRPIGMLHHGLVPHHAVQAQFFPEYLIDDYETVAQKLADAGMGLVFTGHYHSQDVAFIQTPAGYKLYDVETGSLVTAPSPIRYVALDGDETSYTSTHIDSVTGIENFSVFAKTYLLEGLTDLIPFMLQTVNPTLTAESAAALAGQPVAPGITLAQFLASCMAKHYAGDETPGELAPIIAAFQNYSAGDAGTNALYQMLGGAAWALANDTTGNLAVKPEPDSLPDNNGSFRLSATPPPEEGGGGSSGAGGGSSGGISSGSGPSGGGPSPSPSPGPQTETAAPTVTTTTDPATGAVTTTSVWPDGTRAVAIAAATGEISAQITLPSSRIGTGRKTVVRIPAPNANAGTVAVLIRPDGSEELLRDSVAKDGALWIPLAASASVQVRQNGRSYADTNRHWASDAIAFVTARGLLNGTSADSFAPDLPMTRGMLAVVLHRLENTPPSMIQLFTDVRPDAYYAGAVAWAAQTGLVAGVGDGFFQPEANVSREQLAVILHRYAAPPSAAGSLSSFADGAAVSPWAIEAMRWAVSGGLMGGDGGGRLNPAGSATRAEIAAILQRFITNKTTA
jgi:2',3'-cyclic-nucleotide 2'-phosphodiesterase (5'-nucleotidase family)